MKIKERCKKIGAGILGVLAMFATKVNGVESIEPTILLYGVPPTRYAEPTIWEKLYKFIIKFPAIILIPIILIIGLIVYVVKRKDKSKKRKNEKE